MLKKFDQRMIDSFYQGELSKYISNLEEKVNNNTSSDYDLECLEYAYNRTNVKSESEINWTDEDTKNVKQSIVDYKRMVRDNNRVRKILG